MVANHRNGEPTSGVAKLVQSFDFQHPPGRLSKDWDYDDGRAVMTGVVETIAFEAWTGERSFTVRFEVCTGVDTRGLRQFFVMPGRSGCAASSAGIDTDPPRASRPGALARRS